MSGMLLPRGLCGGPVPRRLEHRAARGAGGVLRRGQTGVTRRGTTPARWSSTSGSWRAAWKAASCTTTWATPGFGGGSSARRSSTTSGHGGSCHAMMTCWRTWSWARSMTVDQITPLPGFWLFRVAGWVDRSAAPSRAADRRDAGLAGRADGPDRRDRRARRLPPGLVAPRGGRGRGGDAELWSRPHGAGSSTWGDPTRPLSWPSRRRCTARRRATTSC